MSSRPDAVSAGDVLIRIEVPRNVSRHRIEVSLNGRDVSHAFRSAAESDTLVGRVEGLRLGRNRFEVEESSRRGRARGDSLTLTNHSAEGPVFSGPHIPMNCTASGPPWNLGPVDANCHVEDEVVAYRYRTTAGTFADYNPANPPSDVAHTTTSTGAVVPYIVRVTTGTLNRAVFRSAVLHDPAAAPDPAKPYRGWNRRLIYTFGGGCGVNYWQGSSTGAIESDLFLSRGYGVASSTFNVYSQNCNDVTSAETASMVKERFIETYGPAAFTMGSGASGGTMQQMLIANAYPGILDGVMGQRGYPDDRTILPGAHSCRQLNLYFRSIFDSASPAIQWTAEQAHAITTFGLGHRPGTGSAANGNCGALGNGRDQIDRHVIGCPAALPVVDRYDPITNPDGIRCTQADMMKAVYGTDPETGFGRRAVPDNLGVQYGLNALKRGIISVEQFLHLNETVGGIDADGNLVPERSESDPQAVRRAYATGRVNMFTGGLMFTPIIEFRTYTDFNVDDHDRYRSWMMRERVLAARGDTASHVSVTGTSRDAPAMELEALVGMDRWLTAIKQLEERWPRLSPTKRVAIARPRNLSDGCYDQAGVFRAEVIDYDAANFCNGLYPYHGVPETAAGGPSSGHIIKCRLTRPQSRDYGVARFTPQQWARLLVAFPKGVCDWSKPGVGQVRLEGTWLRYPLGRERR